MKNIIEIPRHKDLGIIITIVVDMGKSDKYVINQEALGEHVLENVTFLDEILKEVLRKQQYEIIEYMKEKGFIKQLN